jgi:hypothetical protein
MSGRVAKATIEDGELLEALEAAEEEHGSMADALRYALRATYAGDDTADERVDTGLPKAAREGYAALREHVNVGDRMALDAAEAIVAQRVQLRKETVRNSVIKKLHNAGWIVVEQGIHEVGIVVRERAAADGGRNGDDDIFGDDGDGVDEAEADDELEKLTEATVDRGEGIETDGGQPLPDGVERLCEEYDLERPTPGERWEFHLTNVPEDSDVGRELVSSGCDLRQEYADGDGRTYEYVVPEPGWPEPLGYVTAETPTWVNAQTRWKSSEKFTGRVRGTIPDAGDCDRHPDLPADAYALKAVHIYGPAQEPTFHAKTSFEVPETAWTVNLTYEQATRSYRTLVEVYSGEFGPFPDCTEWRSGRPTNHERRRVEFFETRGRAVEFVESATGLSMPRLEEQLRTDGGLRPEWAVEDVERELRAVLDHAEDDDARYHTRQALQHLMALEESQEMSR